MLEIASQITICLLIAAAIGFIIGYLVAKIQSDKIEITEEEKAEKRAYLAKKSQDKANAKAKAAEEKAQAKALEDKKTAQEKAEKTTVEAEAEEKDNTEVEELAKKAQAAADARVQEAKASAEKLGTAKAETTESQEISSKKPELLESPRNGEKDDLTQIKGIGPKVADQLNEAGIYHLDQIASWSEENIKWLEIHTTFAHRATKDLWVNQANSLK